MRELMVVRGLIAVRVWALAMGLSLAAAGLGAQSAPPAPKPPAGQSDNPFPGDAPAAEQPSQAGQSGQASPAAPQSAGQKPDSTQAKPKSGSDNPFPGEDPNAPIIPVEPSAGDRSGTGRAPDSARSGDSGAGAGRRDADPDGDPVRSPDGAGRYANDDGFSSSRGGISQVPTDDDDTAQSKSMKDKTRKQVIKEDLDVGGFYLDKKNWKAAQGRFASAFALDAENPDSVWGLAEAERHLQLYKDAAEHYKLFLSYEPDGKRGKEARKALEEIEAAQPTARGNGASK